MPAKRILIVEDNEDNRRILVYRLRKIGNFELLEAGNGIEALEILKNSPPDLIFLDLKMPVMDGWETARRIRAMEGSIHEVPIIAITAQAMAGDEEIAISSGCDDYLAKPIVDSRVVREKLERFLGPVEVATPAGGTSG
ncbi:MAG TPA: response regulator [Myxococcota bacterium]